MLFSHSSHRQQQMVGIPEVPVLYFTQHPTPHCEDIDFTSNVCGSKAGVPRALMLPLSSSASAT